MYIYIYIYVCAQNLYYGTGEIKSVVICYCEFHALAIVRHISIFVLPKKIKQSCC